MQKDTRNLLITIAVIFIAFFGFVYYSMNNGPKVEPVSENTLIRPASHTTAKGIEKPPVTLVEFGDFQCPACSFLHVVLKQIENEPEFENKINFVFRNYPLPMHKNAQLASHAAEAAAEQGKFFEMHDLLFETQKDWSESDTAKDIFIAYAKSLGLDEAKFTSDMTSNKKDVVIQQDQADGNSLGITGTPTLYINGTKYEGGLSYDNIKNAIKSALNT